MGESIQLNWTHASMEGGSHGYNYTTQGYSCCQQARCLLWGRRDVDGVGHSGFSQCGRHLQRVAAQGIPVSSARTEGGRVSAARCPVRPVSSALSRRRTVIPAPSRASTRLRMRAGSGCGDRGVEESGCGGREVGESGCGDCWFRGSGSEGARSFAVTGLRLSRRLEGIQGSR